MFPFGVSNLLGLLRRRDHLVDSHALRCLLERPRLALGMRSVVGGVRDRGGVLRQGATPLAELRQRFGAAGVRLAAPAAGAPQEMRRPERSACRCSRLSSA